MIGLMMKTVAFLVALIFSFGVGAPSARAADGADVVASYLSNMSSNVQQCSTPHNSIMDTVNRLKGVNFPTQGKFVLVNIPGGFLMAYENGQPVFDMKIMIGKETHQTPEYDTQITGVRLNPIWTAPWSIVQEENWFKKLKEEPEFFARNRFEFRDKEDNLIPLMVASKDPSKVAKFIQAPGPYNVLGEFRFDIGSSQSIYLHDTIEREAFYDGSSIAQSHGCVRVEKPYEFAAWLLGWDMNQLRDMVMEGNSVDMKLSSPVPIVMGYYTAWPDALGNIEVFPDVYKKVKASCDVNQ